MCSGDVCCLVRRLESPSAESALHLELLLNAGGQETILNAFLVDVTNRGKSTQHGKILKFKDGPSKHSVLTSQVTERPQNVWQTYKTDISKHR